MAIHASNHRAVRAVLGERTCLTDQQERLLNILLDPDNHTQFDLFCARDDRQNIRWILGRFEALYRDKNSVVHDTQTVADVLQTHYDRLSGRDSSFCFSWGGDVDQRIAGLEVGVYLGTSPGENDPTYLLEYHAMVELNNDSAGLRHALHVALILDEAYGRILRRVRQASLLFAADDTRARAADEQHVYGADKDRLTPVPVVT